LPLIVTEPSSTATPFGLLTTIKLPCSESAAAVEIAIEFGEVVRTDPACGTEAVILLAKAGAAEIERRTIVPAIMLLITRPLVMIPPLFASRLDVILSLLYNTHHAYI
jgi:hypothetical protein